MQSQSTARCPSRTQKGRHQLGNPVREMSCRTFYRMGSHIETEGLVASRMPMPNPCEQGEEQELLHLGWNAGFSDSR